MTDWLEVELTRQLARTEAPAELWERISGAGTRPAKARLMWAAVPVAAMAAVLLLTGGTRPPDLAQMATEQLRDPAPLDLRSSDPAEISRWIGSQVGVELTIPERTGVRLMGARVIGKRGARIGAVEYRVGAETAMLLVARTRGRGQTYGLASSDPGRPEAACALCHAL